MNNKKSLFLSIVMIFSFISLTAQPKENSPYSRFGIGDMTDNNFVFISSTGLGATMYHPYEINITNPATYGYLRSTAFALGLYTKYSKYTSKNNSSKVWSGNLQYISLGIPLINPYNDILEKVRRKYDIGLSITLMPHSIVGFNIKSEETLEDDIKISRIYQGSGGTYKVVTGLGGRYENVAFGINAGYFFGQIDYDRALTFSGLSSHFSNTYHTDYSVSGFLYNTGFLYNLVLNKKALKEGKADKARKLVFGLYGNTKTYFSTTGKIFNYTQIYNINNSEITKDTVLFDEDIKGKGTLPVSIGGGILYNNGKKWLIGIDYNKTYWNQYTNEIKKDTLLNTFSISLGAQYTPDENSITSFYKRVNYSFNVYYKTDPRNENGTQFNEKGLHLGFGFPFAYKRKISRIDFDINMGKRGSGLKISENFVKIGFNVTFNDSEWFIKRKYY